MQPKTRTPRSKTTTSPDTSTTTTVTVQVNPLEVDPYDELPGVIEVAPPIPPHPNKMDQSVYANFYENYPPGGTLDGRNGLPSSRNPTVLPRSASPKTEEGQAKSVSFATTKSYATTNTSTPATTAAASAAAAANPCLTAECNNENHQVKTLIAPELSFLHT
ncbi:unnamed protein product [Hydatigera taeniaeformis]|uniref:Uncharacterized protein n=1 Tax=Hydatigena taeniaeformis TaxID=6205 RepID=A0A0R3WW35_HYDTA|nr:unnamed protein product [Hydatigera taeniaeformis]